MQNRVLFAGLSTEFNFVIWKIIDCDINEQFTRYILYKLFDLS